MGSKKRLTQRALDAGDSAAFSGISLASSFLCSQVESTPAPAPVTRAVILESSFMKKTLLLFAVVSMLIASCNSKAPVGLQTPMMTTPSQVSTMLTSFPEPTKIANSTKTSVIASTFTPQLSDEPGLIVTLDGGGHADLGIPIFSLDGKVVALAGSVIRIWNVNSHELVRELSNPYAGICFVRNAKFSPDSNLFAISLQSCDGIDSISAGRILMWDLHTGKLLQEWKQETAKMSPSSSGGGDYTIPVAAMAFLPNSSSMVFASGNTLETRDVYQDEIHDVINLGPEMYASQISSSPDGKLAYVVMSWTKTNDLPETWKQQHKLEIWDINTHTMLHETKYPESWSKLSLDLLDKSLVVKDLEKGTNQVLNIESGEVRDIPFRLGQEYFNTDGSLMANAGINNTEQSIELWNTETWQNLYTFVPDFEKDWLYSMTGLAFSSDNTMLAIAHNDQLSLWNIRPVVQP